MNDRRSFRFVSFLLDHVKHTMAFYHPKCIDGRGGFYHCSKDHGSKYRPDSHHLVSSTRFIFNYSMVSQLYGDPQYQDAVRHGVKFLREKHRNAKTGGYYFWVQAEALATAALLADKTGKDEYWHWDDRLWDYSWKHFVDQKFGAWFRILKQDNSKYDDEKSPAGKTDYHTMGTCYEVLNAMR